MIKRKRTILIALAALIFLVFIAWKFTGSRNRQPLYQTVPVTRDSIISTITSTGNISADGEMTVSSPAAGEITDLYVWNGDTVTTGQNLFRVRASATQEDQAAAYATYMNALSALKAAQSSKLSAQSLLEKDRQAVIDASTAVAIMQNNLNVNANNPVTKQSYTQNDIDSIKSAYTSAEETFRADESKYLNADTSINASQAQASSAWQNYRLTQDAIVRAPVSGTVANLSVSVGSQVPGTAGNSAGGNQSGTGQSGGNGSGSTSAPAVPSSVSSVTSGSPVLVIGNFSDLSISAQINETDIPNIHSGQKAVVTLDAYPGKTYAGVVTGVDSVGTISSGVVTYIAHIRLESPPSTVLPGMSSTVVIETARHDHVLAVPNGAVQTANGQSEVRVWNNSNLTMLPVETGISSDTETEIVSGLSEGQTVVIGNIISGNTSQNRSPFSALGGRGFGAFGGAGRGGR